MSTPNGDAPKIDNSIDSTGLEDGIKQFVEPVVNGLRDCRDRFTEAHGEVKAAHDSSAPGWFGGEGNGEVRAASSSFLNEVT